MNVGAAADGPIQRYHALSRSGELEPDPVQELAMEKLQILHHRLRNYDPTKTGGWQELLGLRQRESPPQGLYLYGGVGRGKSMVMDLFFEGAPTANKRRVHFHAFMQEVHERFDRFRKTPPDRRDGDDPIPPAARDIAADCWLLCFDEFEVRDVADAMILGRLFTRLFEHGVVVVATSNRAPSELYKGGLNRDLFLPFIDLIQSQLDVLHLDGGQDYRLDRLRGSPVYHVPLDEAAVAALDKAFFDLTDQAAGDTAEHTVKGRTLIVPEQAKGVARFDFPRLCETPLAAADYLELARAYHTLILSEIPRLGPQKRNEARRFVMLIDVLYDNGIKLICSAQVPPDDLYPAGDGTFEFARTVSRLIEMQAESYLAAPH